MAALTFKDDTLKPEDEQPHISWDLPEWVDGGEVILRADCDPDLCVAGVLQDEHWRGYPKHSLIVQYMGAQAYHGYRIAVSEQTIYDLKPED